MNPVLTLQTVSSILFDVLALFGIVFAVYRYFRDPQVTLDTTSKVEALRVGNLEGSVKLILENHLPHIDQRLISIREDINKMNESLVRLQTIIEERIPRKK